MSCINVKIYISKAKAFIYRKVIIRFLSNLQRLNKIMKSVKSTNLKTN